MEEKAEQKIKKEEEKKEAEKKAAEKKSEKKIEEEMRESGQNIQKMKNGSIVEEKEEKASNGTTEEEKYPEVKPTPALPASNNSFIKSDKHDSKIDGGLSKSSHKMVGFTPTSKNTSSTINGLQQKSKSKSEQSSSTLTTKTDVLDSISSLFNASQGKSNINDSTTDHEDIDLLQDFVQSTVKHIASIKDKFKAKVLPKATLKKRSGGIKSAYRLLKKHAKKRHSIKHVPIAS